MGYVRMRTLPQAERVHFVLLEFFRLFPPRFSPTENFGGSRFSREVREKFERELYELYQGYKGFLGVVRGY
jgi:hypothetical protein